MSLLIRALPALARVLTVTLAGGALLGACSHETPTEVRPAPDASGLASATVSVATLDTETLLDGTVEALNQATISAQTSARVVELPVDVGDTVQQGQVIARLRGTQAQASAEAARAGVSQAQSHLAEVKLRYERTQDVYQRQLIAKAQFDQVNAEYQAAQAQLAAAKAALAQAEEGVGYTEIKAPWNGVIVSRDIDVGELASPGQPLLRGVSLDALRVRLSVPQQTMPALRRYQSASLVLDNGQRIAAAQLRLPPAADPATQSFGVVLELPANAASTLAHGGTLLPGTLVKVAIRSGERQSLQVPNTALVQRGELTGVYVIRDGHLGFRTLRVGNSDGSHTAVLAGLAAGEQVAIDPLAATARMTRPDPQS